MDLRKVSISPCKKVARYCGEVTCRGTNHNAESKSAKDKVKARSATLLILSCDCHSEKIVTGSNVTTGRIPFARKPRVTAAPNTPDAVSYTHLDVYKRQACTAQSGSRP